MAEFQEVVEQKRRMCKMYEKGCKGCPLSNGDCGVLNIRFADANTFQRLEDTVMSWAADHPEPVYPSWYEYLTDMYPATWNMIKDKPIPADIAEKLGIEPKEG